MQNGAAASPGSLCPHYHARAKHAHLCCLFSRACAQHQRLAAHSVPALAGSEQITVYAQAASAASGRQERGGSAGDKWRVRMLRRTWRKVCLKRAHLAVPRAFPLLPQHSSLRHICATKRITTQRAAGAAYTDARATRLRRILRAALFKDGIAFIVHLCYHRHPLRRLLRRIIMVIAGRVLLLCTAQRVRIDTHRRTFRCVCYRHRARAGEPSAYRLGFRRDDSADRHGRLHFLSAV